MKKLPAKPPAKPVKTMTGKLKRPGAARQGQRRKLADRRLPDFRDLADNAVQGMVVHDNFKPLYANQAFAALFGFTAPDEVLGLPLLRPLIPQDLWARAEQDYDDLIKGRKTTIVAKMRALKKDGSEIWLAITMRVTAWHNTKAVQVSALDITAQMAVEQHLLHSEQHLRSILEILPYPIYIARRTDGQLLFVNRKTCLLFQRGANQLLRSTSHALYAEAEERDKLTGILERLHDIRDVEVKMKTGAGRIFTAELAAIAMDYAGSPANLVALNDISQRKEMEAELFRQASTDGLTGVSNRRHFMAQAENELRRTRRFTRDLSVLMIDIDHFKKINDGHGHAAGDAVLQGMVRQALTSLRQSDLLGRMGGEEFAVFLPETGLQAAIEAAERLRRAIGDRPLIVSGAIIPCTVSVGVAQLREEDKSIDDLLKRADAALYRAKESGRDRVEVAA